MIIRKCLALMRNDTVTGLIGLCLLSSTLLAAGGQSVTANPAPKAEAVKSVRLVGTEQWAVFEASFTSARKYDNPFLDVQVDVVCVSTSHRSTPSTSHTIR